MPWQLIYTSAPRGLLSGQSGFCTVARSRDLREALVQRLEQISSYHYLRVAEAATASRNPTVCAFRVLDFRGTRYHVLTRIQPAGLDFTARTNHLAHHVVFQGHELSVLPSPAAILSLWSGWLSCWQGEPRLVEDPSLDSFAVSKTFLPAHTWLRMTGDAGRAAGLLETEYTRGCYLLCPDGSEQQLLEMYGESLQLLNLHGQYALRPWRHTFTTFLQAEDNPVDFHWRACQEGTPACQDAVKRGLPLVPLRGIRVPMNSLVKSARDGAKPLPPSSSAPAPAVTRPQPNEPVKANEPAPPGTPPPSWEEPVFRAKSSRLLDINLSLGSATLMRVGVFVAVLAGLLVVKFVFFKKHPLPEVAPRPVAEIAPKESPVIAPVAPGPPKPDLSALNWLPADEPTYVLILGHPENFELPINAISRFQNLLNRYDRFDLKPADIRLAANMDQWNFQGGAPLAVQSRKGQTLAAKSDTGLECSFDYSNLRSDPQMRLSVRTSFTTPPAAFSMRFGFSNPQDGEPFRLLIVNQSNPPVPLRLGKEWIRADGDGLVGSLTPPLGERLQGDFILMGPWHWQLEPFIDDRKGSQTNWLYQHWPAEDMPPSGGELDFVRTKLHLSRERQALETKAATLTDKIRHQIDGANFDTPLAADLRVKKPELASFSAYVSDPSTDDFLQYLNALKRAARAKSPPHFDDNEDESSLAAKFEQWHDWWINKVPEASAKLTVGGTNYFAAVWQSLKGIDKIRLEKQGVMDKIQRLRAESKEVPENLDKVAYVSLYLTGNARPGLEVIRFAGP